MLSVSNLISILTGSDSMCPEAPFRARTRINRNDWRDHDTAGNRRFVPGHTRQRAVNLTLSGDGGQAHIRL